MNANIHSFVIRAKFFGPNLGLSNGYAAWSWYPASLSFCFSVARRELLTVTDHMLLSSSRTNTLVSLFPFPWDAIPPEFTTLLCSGDREEPWALLNFSLWPKEFTPPVQLSKKLFFIYVYILPQRRYCGQRLI